MSDDLTPREVAELLGVTVRTVQRWIADGRLAATRVGSRVRVSRSSLAAVSSGVDADPVDGRPRIRSLLIANRGEIAARVARTARELGIRVVGVRQPDDHGTAALTDEWHEVGSYLDAEAILDIARRSGADAIHPGYGFLAENPSFARATAAAGIAWIGPPADAIAAMGDKAEARRRAAALGVPTVPGYDGAEQDDATLAREAERIGYPLLIKPSAGGGGKGMRIVESPDTLAEQLAASRREALRSFGDDRLVLERYLPGARHVEIQVLFDTDGHGVHLGERDCSTQRRNQKIVEEAPAPSVDAGLRARMGEAALRVAGGIGYASAGTVEMLLTDDREFFFLEMNTRLQVEHPVTEAVTGRDLVADQLRIAEGATLADLGLTATPPIRGHAIEVRLYAEDPESGFLPATGRLARLRWPEGIRVDAGVSEGDAVTDRYDPMLAKLIAAGPTREEALRRLADALDATRVLGVRTNLRFLRWLLRTGPMRNGDMRTDTLASLDMPAMPVPGDEHWRAAAWLLRSGDDADPWGGGWRLNGPPFVTVEQGEERRAVPLNASPADRPDAVRDGDVVHVDLDGQSLEFRAARPPSVGDAQRHAGSDATGDTTLLAAPMPGRVIAVRVTEGGAVRAHEAIVVIEAMKMEHTVVAPIDGVLSSLRVSVGSQVERGERIGEVTAASKG